MPSSKERRKEIYEERKSKGICVQCGKKPARVGIIFCEECQERKLSLRRKRYRENPEKELSQQTKRYNEDEEHRKKQLERSKQYYQEHKKQKAKDNKERYEWLKEHHICVQCGSQEAVYNMVRCADCLEKQYLAQRESRNETARLYRLKKKSIGECTRCKRPAVDGFTLCEHHRNIAQKSYYKRKFTDDELHELRSQLGKKNIHFAFESENNIAHRIEFRKQTTMMFT